MTLDGRRLAAVMAYGRKALLSHRAAAACSAIFRGDHPIEVTAPRSAKPQAGIVLHRTRTIAPEDRASLHAIPLTSPARTLVDLADVLTERRLADAVHEAEVQRIFDLREVEAAIARVPGRRGLHKLRCVLRRYEVPHLTRNDAERAFLRLCNDLALPSPQSNVLIGPHEVDFHWPDAKLVVELDGAATHGTQRAFVNDRRRDRYLATRGIQVLRITWWDLVDQPSQVAREVRSVLLARC
jgi:very-short-patch-repair endonuclease